MKRIVWPIYLVQANVCCPDLRWQDAAKAR